jgi:hypothetical protein
MQHVICNRLLEVKIFIIKKINASLRIKEMAVWSMPIFLKRAYEKSVAEVRVEG